MGQSDTTLDTSDAALGTNVRDSPPERRLCDAPVVYS
jgi:hypothetical protein